MQDFENDSKNNSPKDLKKTHQIFKDDETDERVREHLRDEDDEITVEDIKNIKTEMTAATEEDFRKAARKEGFSDQELEDIKNAEN